MRPLAFEGADLAVHKRAEWEPLAGLGNVRELLCEKVSSPGPERHPGGIPPGKATVSIELNLIEPFVALG
jgi:hypothetical protein